MRSSSSTQSVWLSGSSTLSLSAHPPVVARRSFGPDYFLRLPATSMDEDDDGAQDAMDHNPGVDDGGLPTTRTSSAKPRRRIPLPFLDECTLPTWKSAPRRERDEFWTRLKEEIFSLVDDRYLVDHCLFEPHDLLDSSFKSSFLEYKRRRYASELAKPKKPFITQMDLTSDHESTCTLASLQHRLKLITTHPLKRGRLDLLKMDCAIGRTEAAQKEAHEISEEGRMRDEEAQAIRMYGRNRPGGPGMKASTDEEKTPARKKKPTSTTSASKKKSKVASKLRGALGRGDGSDDDSDSRAPSPRRPALSSFLRSEEEQEDAANLVRMEKESTARLLRLFEQGQGKEVLPATSPTKKPAIAGPSLHLQSDWLERCLNLVLVRAGHRTLLADHAHALSRRQKVLSVSERENLEAREQLERNSSTVPGANFLPPLLSPLASRPGSFLLAQGVLRDVLRVSDRLANMVRRREFVESLHPLTGQTMLTLTLFEDDDAKVDGTTPSADHSPDAFLARVFGWFTPPVLKCFFNYARSPFVWTSEKTARGRVSDLASASEAQDRLRGDLDLERDSKLNMLRDLQSTHQLRVLNDLERKLEEDVARLRETHLANVAVEVAKIASEFERMQSSIVNYYEQEQKELATMQRRVEQRRTLQLAKELARYTTQREEVLENEHVARLALFAHRVQAHDLFDACLEIVATHLPRFFHEPVFLSPHLPPGTHRLIFSHASLADLKHVGGKLGVSCAQLEAAVEKALASNKIVEDHIDLTQPTLADSKQIAAHVVHLQRTFHAHTQQQQMQSSSNGTMTPNATNAPAEDGSVIAALGQLVDKMTSPEHQLCEGDLSAFEQELQHLFEFRSGSGSLKGDDVRHVRGVLKLLNELRVRACVRDELQQRTTMIHQVLMHSVSAVEGSKDTTDGGEVDARPQAGGRQAEQAYNVQKIIQQITKAYKGKSSMDASTTLANMATEADSQARASRAADMAERRAAGLQPESLGGDDEAEGEALVPVKSNRSLIALALFKEITRRVIAGLKLRAGWLQESPNGTQGLHAGMPRCLRLSHNSRRITVARPYRYGTLHSALGFTRLEETLPDLEKAKHRWFFEVTIGPMDEGFAQAIVGFDMDPPSEGDLAAGETTRSPDGLPFTTVLRSGELMQREHEEALRIFERTQYERFSRALPMLAAATSAASVAPVGPGSAEALARHIGGMLHGANEKAASAQQAVQLQLLAAQANQSRPMAGKQVTAAMAAAGAAAAQAALSFLPPAHLATHPAHTSPAHLTEALLSQHVEGTDPLFTPFAMFPTAAYQLASLSSPPPSRLAQRASGVLWQNDGLMYAHGRTWQVGVGFGEGDVIGCGLDLATHAVYFVKNGQVFMASPDQGQVDRPHEVKQGFRHTMDEDQRGPVIGDHKFMHVRTPVDSDASDEKTVRSSPSSPIASSQPGGGGRPPSAMRLPSSKKKGAKSKAKHKVALDAAILASAAAGTVTSLLDSTRSSSSSAPTSPHPVGPVPSPTEEALAVLKTPLHSSSAEGLERIVDGTLELQKRLALTTGALAIDLPQLPSPAPLPLPSPPTPNSAKSPMGFARGNLADMASARARHGPVLGGLGAKPMSPGLGPLSPLSSMAPSSGSGPFSSAPRRRERGHVVSLSGQASLQQAQQMQLEHQLVSVAMIQTAAAEALANAQQVYNTNQTKQEMLNAAIRAQTQPNAPVYNEIFEAKTALVQEVRARSEKMPYVGLEQAGGLPHLAPRSGTSRRMKRRARTGEQHGEREEGEDGVIDYTDAETDDEGYEPGRMSEGWIEHSSTSALHASDVLGAEVVGLPSTLLASAFSSVPQYFARRFGVSILIPAPHLHLPGLLSTQQLAQVLATGVSTLATSDSVRNGVLSSLHASNHLLLLNQGLVRSALANGLAQHKPKRVRIRNPDDEDDLDLAAAFDVDSGTSLVTGQPLSPPNPASLRGLDLVGSASTPGASHLPRSTASSGATPLANLARVATAARDREATSVAESLSFSSSSNDRGPRSILGARDRIEAGSNVLVHGRAPYTLRPCVCLFSAKPASRGASRPVNLVRAPAPAAGGRRDGHAMPLVLPSPTALGPNAHVTVNFGELPFVHPIDQFRPVTNAN